MIYAIVISYIITGLIIILSDFNQPRMNKPAYVRKGSRKLSIFIIIILGWFYFKLSPAIKYGYWSDFRRYFINFVLMSIFIYLIFF